MGKEEHAASVSHRLLTSEEYRNIRSGTSGVGVLLALTDYAYGFSLPEKYYPANNSQMGVIWTATNIIVSTINDLLSLKKEIAQGQIDTLIPLLYVEHGCDLQRAVNEATTMLEEEISKFERAEANLLATEADEDTKEQLRLFIRGCKYGCTGSLRWRCVVALTCSKPVARADSMQSLGSRRYMLGCEDLHEGLEITI